MSQLKLLAFLKKHQLAFATFMVPFLAMALIYLTLGIFPGSSRSVLASDAFSQFTNFHGAYRNMLLGKQGIFYTWHASLGLNFFALSAYYLGGFLTPLTLLFPNHYLPETLYFLTLVKIGFCGLAFYYYGRRFKFPAFLTVAFSTVYALSGFAMAHSELVMWLDAFIFLPLIFLGIEKIQDYQSPLLLFFSYFGLFISNFYFGFMIGIFSFLYFLVRTLSHWQLYKKRIGVYLTTSILAGMASMVVILPTVFDLKNNGETLSQITHLKTEATGPFDFFLKNFIGAYDTTKYGSLPFIYIGLLPLIFCFFFFLTKKVNFKEKIAYLSLIALLEASFYLIPLNLFWHGMHAPNMFLFRYSFLLGFLILILGLRGFNLYDKSDFHLLTGIILSLSGVFLLVKIFFSGKHEFLTIWNLLLTLLFLTLYLLFFTLWQLGISRKKVFQTILSSLLILEACINGSMLLHGILNDWNYASKSLFSDPYPAISSLVEKTKKQETNFYRLENLDPVSSNDAFNYGYSGISMFSSIRNRHSSGLLNDLGFKSRGTNLNIRYNNNTLIADSLFGIKYNLSKNALNKYGFEKTGQKNDYQLYQNQFSAPLGILTDGHLNDISIPKRDNLTAQSNLFNALGQTDNRFYTFLEPEVVNLENTKVIPNGNQVTYQEIQKNIGKDVTYEVTIPKNKQAYLSLYLMDYFEAKSSTATLFIDGKKVKSQLNITGQYLDLGTFKEAKTITFKVNFYGSPKVTFMKPKVMLLDLPAFEQTAKKIQENELPIQTTNNGAHFSYDLKESKTLFTTIPFDQGWEAFIDGKKVPLSTFKDSFLTLKLPKGKHQVKLRFVPQGFKLGALSFVISSLLFSLYYFWLKKKQKFII